MCHQLEKQHGNYTFIYYKLCSLTKATVAVHMFQQIACHCHSIVTAAVLERDHFSGRRGSACLSAERPLSIADPCFAARSSSSQATTLEFVLENGQSFIFGSSNTRTYLLSNCSRARMAHGYLTFLPNSGGGREVAFNIRIVGIWKVQYNHSWCSVHYQSSQRKLLRLAKHKATQP